LTRFVHIALLFEPLNKVGNHRGSRHG
jgi:hypothetical protein